MVASLKSCGRQWKRQHSLQTACSTAARASPPPFRTSAGMPSAPEALLFFSNLIGTFTAPRGMSASNSWKRWDQRQCINWLLLHRYIFVIERTEVVCPAIKLLSSVADWSTVFGLNSGSLFGFWTDCVFDTLVHAMEVTSVCTTLNALADISPVGYRCRAAPVRHCMSPLAVVRRNLAVRVSWMRTIALALRFDSSAGKSKSALSRTSPATFLMGDRMQWQHYLWLQCGILPRRLIILGSRKDEFRWWQNKVWNRFTLTGSWLQSSQW